MEPPPEAERTRRKPRRKRPGQRIRKREEESLSNAFERAADDERGESDGGEAAGGARPESEAKQVPRLRGERDRGASNDGKPQPSRSRKQRTRHRDQELDQDWEAKSERTPPPQSSQDLDRGR